MEPEVKKEHKFLSILLTILVMVLVALGVAAGVWYHMDQQAKKTTDDNAKQVATLQKKIDDLEKTTGSPSNGSNSTTSTGVTINTDSSEYKKGEVIKITFSNNSGKSVYYYEGGIRLWGIQQYKDGEWIDYKYEDKYGPELVVASSSCPFVLYEIPPVKEFKPYEKISLTWMQRFCIRESGQTGNGQEKSIETGKYRLVFRYGTELSKTDGYSYNGSQDIYSNSVSIK